VPSRPPQLTQFTVTVEANGGVRADPVDGNAVASLVGHLDDYSASVSRGHRSYAVRITVYAAQALDAASEAVEVVRAAAKTAALPEWQISRLEVTAAR
jgi:hypothetical protein